MADFFVLSNADVRDLRAMLAQMRGDVRWKENRGFTSGNNGRIPPHRFGMVVETCTPAVYDGENILQAGRGKVRFQRLKSDGSKFGPQEPETVDVLNISTIPALAGRRTMCIRAQDLCGDESAEPGWYVAPQWDEVGDGGEERHFYLCGGDSKVVLDSDNLTELYLGNYANFDPSTYEVNPDEYSISLKRVGYYTLRHDWILECTTSGGVDSVSEATVYARVGDNVAVADRSTVPCTHIPLRVVNAGVKAGKVIGGCTYYVRAINSTPPYTRISFAMKRVTYLASSLVYLRTAMLRYFGTTAPTLGAFTDPSP